MEGLVDLGTAVKVRSPCPRLYIAAAVAINTTVRCVIRDTLYDVDGEERQVAGDEHREQDLEHLYRRHLPVSHVTLWFRNNILYATCGTASHGDSRLYADQGLF